MPSHAVVQQSRFGTGCNVEPWATPESCSRGHSEAMTLAQRRAARASVCPTAVRPNALQGAAVLPTWHSPVGAPGALCRDAESPSLPQASHSLTRPTRDTLSSGVQEPLPVIRKDPVSTSGTGQSQAAVAPAAMELFGTKAWATTLTPTGTAVHVLCVTPPRLWPMELQRTLFFS